MPHTSSLEVSHTNPSDVSHTSLVPIPQNTYLCHSYQSLTSLPLGAHTDIGFS